LVARLLSTGIALGLAALLHLAVVPWSAAEASALHAVNGTQSTGHAVFRPAQRFGRGLASQRRQAEASTPRAGARKAVPVTRGQELGLRFRPDERESPYGQAGLPPGDASGGLYSPELQSQFRPTQKRRKPSYEELQAESAPPQPMPAPVLPYPIITPPPLPAYGPRW